MIGIVLVGPYNAGKTITANWIGANTGFRVLDLDEMYTQEFGEGIFLTRHVKGEIAAASNRDQIAQRMFTAMTDRTCVAVFGGGSTFRAHDDWFSDVKSNNVVVYLRPTITVLVSRSKSCERWEETSLVLRHTEESSVERFIEKELLANEPDYDRWSDRIVEILDHYTVREIGGSVLAAYLREVTIGRFRNQSK